MDQHSEGWLTRFLDNTALDWILIIVNENSFPEYPRPTAERQKEIQAQAVHLTGESLDTVVGYFEKLLDEENKRQSTIESKAFSLIGITGIASGFIIGFAQFLLGNNSFPGIIRIFVMILYALIGASLLITLILARRAIVVGKYKFMSLIPSDLLKLTKLNHDEIYRERAANLLLSYENNLALINDKATYVRGAQDWFRNTIFLLFTLLMVFTIYLPFRASLDVQTLPEPIPVFIVTPTPIPTSTPTSTPTFTSTPTPPPTLTPSATPVASITP